MNIIKKKEAIEKGLTHYFTGKLCHNGHMSKRFVSTGVCRDCHRNYKNYTGKGNNGKVVSKETKDKISVGMVGNDNGAGASWTRSTEVTAAERQMKSDNTNGSKNGNAKLNEQLVWEMRFGNMKNKSLNEIGLWLNLIGITFSRKQLANILTNPDKSWKRVTGDLYENV